MARRLKEPVTSPYLVPFDGSFCIKNAPTDPPEEEKSRSHQEMQLQKAIQRLQKAQKKIKVTETNDQTQGNEATV